MADEKVIRELQAHLAELSRGAYKLPKKPTDKDFIGWRDLANRWEIADLGLWSFLDKEKARLYRKTKTRFQPAPSTITLGEVEDLWIALYDAAMVERKYWKKIREYCSANRSYMTGSHFSMRRPKDICPIKIPHMHRNLLEIPGETSAVMTHFEWNGKLLPIAEELVGLYRIPPTPASNMQLRRTPIDPSVNQGIAGPKKARRSLPVTGHKETFQNEAKRLWVKGSKKTTAEMVQYLLDRLTPSIGRRYAPDTVRRWIAPYSPKYSRGITGRKKNKKNRTEF